MLRGESLPPGEHKRGRMRLAPALAPLVAEWVQALGEAASAPQAPGA